jgi:hypothetical protein
MALPERHEYESIIYGLQSEFQEIDSSTLRVYSTSASAGTLVGEVALKNGLRIRAVEVLDFGAGVIRKYSYTIYRGDQKIRWYDPQPHPENKKLAATFPHHFHEEPDPSTALRQAQGGSSGQSIKHNRKPAEGISFEAPNLPVLIKICIGLG